MKQSGGAAWSGQERWKPQAGAALLGLDLQN